jgi:protein TonB
MLVLAEQNRTFGYAVAASMALHALLLATRAPPMRPVAQMPPEPPLVAHLVEPAPPPPAPPPPLEKPSEPPKPQSKPPPKRKSVPKAKPRPKPPPIARQSPTRIAPPPPAPPPPLPEPAAKEAPAEPEPAAPPASPSPAPAAPAVAAAPRPDPAIALAQFRNQLVELAKRYKRYPPRAADNGWTGEVVVRVDIAANGTIESVRVKRSSGFEVLDAQALEMFNRAAPQAALPATLRGKAFSVEVRAIYNLSDRPG